MKIRLAQTGAKSLYLAKDHNDITMRFLLRYPGIIDAEVLRAATRSVIESVETLHSSFHANNITAYWRPNYQFEDHTFFEYIRTEDEPLTVAYHSALAAISPESSTQLRCSLIQNSTDSVVVMTVSHLCVDGTDAKYLLCKLAEAYNMIKETGTSQNITVKNGSLAAEDIYKNRSVKEMRSIIQMPDSKKKTVFPFPTDGYGSARMVTTMIPSHIMGSARHKAKLQGGTVNDLLLSAFFHAYSSLAHVAPSAPIYVSSMMDLRKYCDRDVLGCLGNMSGTFSTSVSGCQSSELHNTMIQVAEQTKVVKDTPLHAMTGLPLLHSACRFLPMGILLKLSGKVYGNMSLGLTNLGSISCEDLKMVDIQPNYGVFGGSLKRKPGMQVSAISIGGNCALSIAGYYTDEDEKSLQALLNCMTSEIIKYAS